MGLSAPEIRVELPFSAPKDTTTLEEYYAYYGHDLHFSADYAVFQLNQDVLNVRNPSADLMTFRGYEDK